MVSTVAVVNKDTFPGVIGTLGILNALNVPTKDLLIKVGIYNSQTGICTTPLTLQTIIDAFDKAPKIYVVESDSGAGLGLKRLEIWRDCYSEHVIPFNLSDDSRTRTVTIAGESIAFSHMLFKPNTFVSTHVSRRYERAGDEDLMNMGSIIKNLLGLIPDINKHRFHNQLPLVLLDIYEAIGGIDLAVLDATYAYLGFEKKKATVSPQVLLVGTDAFSVEAVGAHMVGFDPTKMPVLQEAKLRKLGEIEIENIEIVGDIETPMGVVKKGLNELRSTM